MYDYWLVSHTPEPCEKELTNENREGKCNVSLNYSILQYCNSSFRGRPLFRVVHLGSPIGVVHGLGVSVLSITLNNKLTCKLTSIVNQSTHRVWQ